MEKKQRIQILLDRLDVLSGKSSKKTRIAGLTARLNDLSQKRIEVHSDNKRVQKIVQKIVDPRVDTLYEKLEAAEGENVSRYKSLQKDLKVQTKTVLKDILGAAKQGSLTDKKVDSLLTEIARLESGFAAKLVPLANTDALIQAEIDNLRQELQSIEIPEFPEVQEPEDITPKLDALERRINQRIAAIHGGGNMNRNISVGGNSSTLSKYTDVNFVAGSNVGIAVSTNDTTQQTSFTFSAAVPAGGIQLFASVSGTVNALNPTFGYPSPPQAIVGDGVVYFEGNGYSYAASVITMEVPPSQYIKAMP